MVVAAPVRLRPAAAATRRSSPPPDSDFGGVLFTVAAYALVALGLNIVIGYAGLLDLGYVGFYAVGAYTVGRPRPPQHGHLAVPAGAAGRDRRHAWSPA